VGTPSDRGWRYLRQSLERHDGPDTNLRYSKVVFETITGLERASTPPPWLIHRLEVMIPLLCYYNFFEKSYCALLKKKEHDLEWLIRACMRFELLELALELTLSLVHKVRFCPECSYGELLTRSVGRPNRVWFRTHPKPPCRHGYHIHLSTSSSSRQMSRRRATCPSAR
jgi:hypothetical protein